MPRAAIAMSAFAYKFVELGSECFPKDITRVHIQQSVSVLQIFATDCSNFIDINS